jgi:hypothetical protein
MLVLAFNLISVARLRTLKGWEFVWSTQQSEPIKTAPLSTLRSETSWTSDLAIFDKDIRLVTLGLCFRQVSES